MSAQASSIAASPQAAGEHDHHEGAIEGTFVINRRSSWPGMPMGTTLFLGPLGKLRGDGLYVLEIGRYDCLRRVHWRMDGEVWLWEDWDPERSREVFTAEEFERSMRAVARPVVGTFIPHCAELADVMLASAEQRAASRRRKR